MIHTIKAITVGLAACAGLLMLSACGVLGLQPAKEFGDRWEYAQKQSIGARQANARALNLHIIDSRTAIAVKDIADRADDILDVARLANEAGDVTTAEGRLALALSILSSIETELTKRQPNGSTSAERRTHPDEHPANAGGGGVEADAGRNPD